MHHRSPQSHNRHSRASKTERNSPNCHLEMVISALILRHFQLLPFLCTFDININFSHLPRGTVAFVSNRLPSFARLVSRKEFKHFPRFAFSLSVRSVFSVRFLEKRENQLHNNSDFSKMMDWRVCLTSRRMNQRERYSNSPVSYPFSIIAMEIVD